jgi:hypothetical protein
MFDMERASTLLSSPFESLRETIRVCLVEPACQAEAYKRGLVEVCTHFLGVS